MTIDSFINTVHPKYFYISIVGWDGVSKSNGIKLYDCVCKKCSDDQELHGDAIYKIRKEHFMSGSVPCGCSEYTKWTEQQYRILINRKCLSNNKEEMFIGFEKEFVGKLTKLILNCKQHGNWNTTTIHNFLHNNNGCVACANLMQSDAIKKLHVERLPESFTKFKEISNTIHNLKYNYDKFIYVNNQTKGIITCPIHGDYLQTPNSHSIGESGCKYCSKTSYDYEKDGYNYVCKLFNPITLHSITGYGITNKPKQRYYEHRRSCKKYGYLITNWFILQAKDGNEAFEIEKTIKNSFKYDSFLISGFRRENAPIDEYDQIKILINNFSKRI